MADYKPKSSGLKYLKHQISNTKRRLNKINKPSVSDGLDGQVVSMPLTQAESLLLSNKNNKIRLDTMNKLATRLASHLEASHKNYNRAVLKEITETILLVLSEVEQ